MALGAAAAFHKSLGEQAIGMSAAVVTSLWASTAIQIASQVARLAAQTIGEVFEEVIIDGFIETYFQNQARMLGLSEGVGQLISTLMTTVRETNMFGVFNLGGQGSNAQTDASFDVNLNAQTEQDLQHASLTAQLSQLIAERENDQSFTVEDFLKQNKEDVRSIMAEFDLVPSRRETILKMAGIIGSGIFAGLSMIVPGLNFAGFSLYGFSPMIKHLGGKIEGLGTGSTTAMRAALQNARQSITYTPIDWEISRDIDLKNKRLMGVKRSPVDVELRRRSDLAATVQSIGSIGYTGSPVEYLVSAKTKDFNPNIYSALESQPSKQTFYAPSIAVENLKNKMEMATYQRGLIESLGKIKETVSSIEEKVESSTEFGSINLDTSAIKEAIPIEDPITWLLDSDYEGDTYKRIKKNNLLKMTVFEFKLLVMQEYDIHYAIDIFYGPISDADPTTYNIEVGEKVDTLDIEADTTMGKILEKLGIDSTDPLEHFFVVPNTESTENREILAQMVDSPVYTLFKDVLSRNFEGRDNVIKAFGTPEKVAFLSKFYRDVMGYLKGAMIDKFSISEQTLFSKSNGLIRGYITQDLHSSEMSTIWDESRATPDDIARFSKKIKGYINDRFLNFEILRKEPGSFDKLIENRMDETILLILLNEMNTKGVTPEGLYAKFEEFYYEFDSIVIDLHPVTYDLTNPVGLNLFMQNFLQTFYSSPKSKKPSPNSDARTFIGEISEAGAVRPTIIELARRYATHGFQDFDIGHDMQYTALGPNEDINDIIGDLKAKKEIDNFGIDITTSFTPLLINHQDVLYILSPNFISSIEVKNSRKIDSLIAIQDIGIDQFRSIDIDKYFSFGLDKVPVRYEDFYLPVSSAMIPSIFYNIFGTRDPNDMRHSGFNPQGTLTNTRDRKGDSESLFFLQVTKALNAFISTQFSGLDKDALKSHLKEVIDYLSLEEPLTTSPSLPIFGNFLDFALDELETLHNRIRQIATSVFGSKKASKLTTEFYEEALSKFSDNLDKLVQDADNGIRLIWRETLRCFLDSGIILRPNMLPSRSTGFFVIDNNGNRLYRGDPELDDNFFINPGVNFIFVHDEVGNNGIMAVTLENNLLPDGILEGYRDPITSEIIDGVYICNEEGTFLLSRVGYDNQEFFIRDEEWYKAGNAISGAIENNQLTYWRSETKITGNSMTCFLQKTFATVNAIEAYVPPINAILSESSKISTISQDNNFVFKPLTSGKLITTETFFKTYENLIDLRNILKTAEGLGTSTKRAYTNVFIADKLQLFNVRFNPFTGIPDMSTLRSKVDFEGVLNGLFTTEADVLTFLFLKKDVSNTIKPMHESDLTVKQWFSFIYEKIKNYKDDPDTKKERVNKLIEEAQTKFTEKYKENPFDTSEGKEKLFSTATELKAGKLAFEAISRLIGHFTFRLLSMRMINFYGSPKSYRIDITNMPRIADIIASVNHFSIITSTQSPSVPLTSHVSMVNHLFSLFFLDSYINLPIVKNIDSKDAIVRFGYSPISFIGETFISTSSTFDNTIVSQFNGLYKDYKAHNYQGSFTNNRIKLFVESGLEMLKPLKSVLKTYLETLGLKKDEQIELYNRLLITAEREILDYSQNPTIFKDYNPESNLRIQIEDLITGDKFSGRIIFYQVDFKGTSFVLPLTKNDFNGRDIKILRTFKNGEEGIYKIQDFDHEAYNNGLIKEKAQILKESIISAVGKSGKVSIYPSYRPNQIVGYQFLLIKTFLPNVIPVERPTISGTNKKDARRFDIDLQDKDLQSKLEHIIKLSLSYIKPSGGGVSSFTRDFLFLIFKEDIGNKPAYEHNLMIGAFDRHRFYSPDEILSTGSGTDHYKPIKITGLEIGIDINPDLIIRWKKATKFLALPVDKMFPTNYRYWWLP